MQEADLEQSLQGRVALLTGASGGIGQALALSLARETFLSRNADVSLPPL